MATRLSRLLGDVWCWSVMVLVGLVVYVYERWRFVIVVIAVDRWCIQRMTRAASDWDWWVFVGVVIVLSLIHI